MPIELNMYVCIFFSFLIQKAILLDHQLNFKKDCLYYFLSEGSGSLNLKDISLNVRPIFKLNFEAPL